MPKQVPAAELDAIVATVGGLPGGGSVSRIRESLGRATTKRTLQRRLAELVGQGRLVQEGRGPGTVYRLAQTSTPPKALTFEDHGKPQDLLGYWQDVLDPIPLSAEGVQVAHRVRAPIQKRDPVGFRRDFLDRYIPGQTYYLPSPLRDRLRELGRSTDQNPVPGTLARKIFQRLLIDLSWNSSRLEGNTYSLLETAHLLDHAEAANNKDKRETQMILNHKSAINFLVDQAEQSRFDRPTILNLHALLAENLLADSQAWGSLRQIAVNIQGTTYHPPEIPQLLEECFNQTVDKAAAISDPLEHAFFVLVHLPYLQPFMDVNKRVSRLAANLPLIRDNLIPVSFVDVPQRIYIDGLLGVYERNNVALLRDVFAWAYARSCARYSVVLQSVVGEPDPLRLRHRDLISRTIREVVHGRMDKLKAAALVRQRTDGLASTERSRVAEVVETDLLNLHEGNVATAGVSTEAFAAWQPNWQ